MQDQSDREACCPGIGGSPTKRPGGGGGGGPSQKDAECSHLPRSRSSGRLDALPPVARGTGRAAPAGAALGSPRHRWSRTLWHPLPLALFVLAAGASLLWAADAAGAGAVHRSYTRLQAVHHHAQAREHRRLQHTLRHGALPLKRALADSEPAQAPYTRAVDMGVYQYEVPGTVELDGYQESVVMHFFLKGMLLGDTVTFRGNMFAESTEEEWYNWGGTGLCMPQIVAGWMPRIFFREVQGARREHDFRVYKEVMWSEQAEPSMGTEEERFRICLPFPFELNLTLADASTDFELRIDGWKNFVYFSPGAIHKPQPPPPAVPSPRGIPEVWAVLVPFLHPTPQAAANNLLHLYIQYHSQLGFQKFIQYTQSTYLAGFLADERLQKLVAAGKLEYVLWDGSTECTGHPKCMQPVMYSHAVLAYWGHDVYLSTADHDEYLALPNPDKYATVQDVVEQCFGGHTQVNLKRYNVVCGMEECGHLSQSKEVEETVELDLWVRGSAWQHPLTAYTLRAEIPFNDDRGKCMVHPQHMAGMQVHYGMVLPSGSVPEAAKEPYGIPIQQECAIWVHLVNLFKGRDDRKGFTPDTRWHWIFDRLEEGPWRDLTPEEEAAMEAIEEA